MIGIDKIGLAVESTAYKASCPKCQEESIETHSTYTRYPKDLAWAEWTVVLHLEVKRFFCRNSKCSKKTFAEQFPGLVKRYARRTERVLTRQKVVGMNVCARTTEKLLQLAQIGVSDTTVNRLIRDLPDPEAVSIRVLGVDDWAKRKRHSYGTILIDHERKKVVDILSDREAESIQKWLEEHPGIEIITRDRGQNYIEGISLGAPEAIQVADRFHLLQNLREMLQRMFERCYQELKTAESNISQALSEDVAGQVENQCEEKDTLPSTVPPDQKAPSYRERKFSEVKSLGKQNLKYREIARRTGLDRRTVKKYLLTETLPIITRPRQNTSKVSAYQEFIKQRVEEGEVNTKKLFQEIQSQGFTGSYSSVWRAVRRCSPNTHKRTRKTHLKPFSLSPNQAAWALVRKPDDDQKQDLICKIICESSPTAAHAYILAQDFGQMIRERQSETLDDWLKKAEDSKIEECVRFAKSLRSDYAAIKAALVFSWSNGATEGHVNRLKCLKRQMYGRAKDDLLRKRVLWQGRWTFT
jgi:transposase